VNKSLRNLGDTTGKKLPRDFIQVLWSRERQTCYSQRNSQRECIQKKAMIHGRGITEKSAGRRSRSEGFGSRVSGHYKNTCNAQSQGFGPQRSQHSQLAVPNKYPEKERDGHFFQFYRRGGGRICCLSESRSLRRLLEPLGGV
jgi:hypothetical protein